MLRFIHKYVLYRPIKMSLAIYSVALLFFLFWRTLLFIEVVFVGGESIKDNSLSEIAQSFLNGLRFDSVISCYLIALPFLLLSLSVLVKSMSNIFSKSAYYLILISFSLAYFVCAADIPFFIQFFNRFDITAFQWIDSPKFMFSMIAKEPRYIVGLFPLLVSWFSWKKVLDKIWEIDDDNEMKLYKKHFGFVALIFITLLVLGMRGRLEKKSPIRVGTAYFCNDAFLNKLGLNPVFTLLRSVLDASKPENKIIHLMPEREALQKVKLDLHINDSLGLNPLSRNVKSNSDKTFKPNVILVIMESMSASKMGRFGNKDALTPFLDSLANVGISFDHFYSAGIHTYNGIFSTLYSFPALFHQHALKTVPIHSYHGLPHILSGNGYYNTFFTTHDGQFDNMEGFLKANGYDKVVSQKDYPSEKIQSALGVADDYLFEFGVNEINQNLQKERPFFATFMTASDHGPFIIPSYFHAHHTDAKKGVVEYADWSIKSFLDNAKRQPWFENTIFVFVADHGGIIDPIYSMPLSYHHIPFIIYQPSDTSKMQRVEDGFGGQIDVVPTLLHLLPISYYNSGMGVDLFDSPRDQIFFSADNKFGVINKDFYMINENDQLSLYDYKAKNKQNLYETNISTAKSMDQFAKSYMQVFQYMLSHDLMAK